MNPVIVTRGLSILRSISLRYARSKAIQYTLGALKKKDSPKTLQDSFRKRILSSKTLGADSELLEEDFITDFSKLVKVIEQLLQAGMKVEDMTAKVPVPVLPSASFFNDFCTDSNSTSLFLAVQLKQNGLRDMYRVTSTSKLKMKGSLTLSGVEVPAGLFSTAYRSADLSRLMTSFRLHARRVGLEISSNVFNFAEEKTILLRGKKELWNRMARDPKMGMFFVGDINTFKETDLKHYPVRQVKDGFTISDSLAYYSDESIIMAAEMIDAHEQIIQNL